MTTRWMYSLALLALLPAFPAPARAQAPRDAAALLAAEREAMKPLAFMDGIWRGPAWTLYDTGERHDVTQTERIGPFLDSTVKVIEGRSYDAAGKVTFNAFGIVSFDPVKKLHTLHSHAMGMAGDFPLTPSDSGYVWEIPAGPTTIRFTATIRAGKWHEIGERVQPGKEPVQFFEMNLVRVGATDWPAAGAVSKR